MMDRHPDLRLAEERAPVVALQEPPGTFNQLPSGEYLFMPSLGRCGG